MRRHEYWQQRLNTAVREAEDAERVWRAAVSAAVPCSDTGVLWRERELARARVRALQREVARCRPPRQRRTRQSGPQTLAFLAWHLSTRRGRAAG